MKSRLPPLPDWAAPDTFWRDRLRVWQPARGQGYRFNLDAVLLARFCPPAQSAVELGAGCGIVSLLLLGAKKAAQVTAVERQADLAAMAMHNAVANGFEACLNVVPEDLREAQGIAPADLVLFNPPYFAKDKSRAGQHPGRDAARRECHGTLADFARVARGLCRPGGTVAAIVPWFRSAELAQCFEQKTQEAWGCAVLQPVISHPESAPRHALMAFRADAPKLADCPACEPWVVHDASGLAPDVRPWVEGEVAC